VGGWDSNRRPRDYECHRQHLKAQLERTRVRSAPTPGSSSHPGRRHLDPRKDPRSATVLQQTSPPLSFLRGLQQQAIPQARGESARACPRVLGRATDWFPGLSVSSPGQRLAGSWLRIVQGQRLPDVKTFVLAGRTTPPGDRRAGRWEPDMGGAMDPAVAAGHRRWATRPRLIPLGSLHRPPCAQ
jgi:hypothetical protein